MGNNSNPLVTIGVPTYNRAASFLPNALANAVGQTYDNIEIIVSDNCSTDHTEEVVKQYSDSRLRYIKQPHNIGANNNFNYCLNMAKGDFFLLMLDDDLIDPDFVETCINSAHTNYDIGIIRTGTRILDKNGNVLLERVNKAAGMTLTEMLLAWFSNELTFYVCSTLFNTRHLRAIGGFGSKHNLFQDVMAEVKLAAHYGRIDIYEAKAGFCVHEENMGASAKVLGWCEDSLDLLDIMCSLAPADKKLLRKEGKRFFCKMNYLYARKLPSLKDRLKTYLMVAKMFDHAYSPVDFTYQYEIKPALQKLKNPLKHLSSGSGR